MNSPHVNYKVVERKGVKMLEVVCPWCGETHYHSLDFVATGRLAYGKCCLQQGGEWGTYFLTQDVTTV